MSFDENANKYLHSSDHRGGSDIQLIQKLLPQKFESLLDIASAAGHCANAVDAYSKTVCDLSHNMLRCAKEEWGYDRAVRCSADALPFKHSTFDISTCRIAMHHFADVPAFFKEVRRVTDGLFVLIDSVVDIEDSELNKIELIRDETHIKSRTVQEILNVADASFRLLHYQCIYKEHDFDEWANRLSPYKEQFDRIYQAFTELPDEIKAELRLKYENGRIKSYTDKKGFFIFRTI